MDEEDYWNDSVAKGFSWEEGDDTIGMPDLRFLLFIIVHLMVIKETQK